MPKRSSPRKLSKRCRRRIQCSRCGANYSYSGSRSHSCGQKAVFGSDKEDLEHDGDNVNGISDTELQEEESDVRSDCHDDDDTEAAREHLVSSDLQKRLRDRLRKRFNEEDLAHFDEDDSDSAECGNDSSGDSVNENWESCQEDGDVEEDFGHEQGQGLETANKSLPLSEKCGILIYWLLLFLLSWQCGFSLSDSAVDMLLKFLSRYFWAIGTFDENGAMAKVAKCMPNTFYKLKKLLGVMNNDDFVKYVVCPKCKTLYNFKDCIQKRCGRQVSARCNFVAWSRHPHRNRRGKSTLYYIFGDEPHNSFRGPFSTSWSGKGIRWLFRDVRRYPILQCTV